MGLDFPSKTGGVTKILVYPKGAFLPIGKGPYSADPEVSLFDNSEKSFLLIQNLPIFSFSQGSLFDGSPFGDPEGSSFFLQT